MIRFKLLGYPISISYYFSAMLEFLLLIDESGAAFAGLMAAGCHELGHILMMWCLRCPKCSIRFTAYGIKIIQRNFGGYGYWRDFFIAVAGAAVNFLFFGLLTMLDICFPCWTLKNMAMSQLAIGAFNILPIYPLDGGQAVYSLLCSRCSLKTAGICSNICSFFFLTPLACYAFYILFQSKYNFSMLVMVGYLLCLLFLKEK